MPQDVRIQTRDVSIFNILTAMTSEDRRSFLDVQNVVRDFDQQYSYLEVGSELGGSLIAPLIDSRCRTAISIDIRTPNSPDERGKAAEYAGNSTKSMIEGLRSAGATSADLSKLRTFDSDASAVTLAAAGGRCRFAFIDAEHTNRAVFRDFLSVRKLMFDDAVVAFHDADIVFDGLLNVEEVLRDEGVVFTSFYFPDRLFALAFGRLATEMANACRHRALNHERFLAQSREELNSVVARNTFGPQAAIDQLIAEAAALHVEAEAAHTQLNVLLTSTTWRATAPLRAILSRLPPSARRRLRQVAKAGWWIATTPRRLILRRSQRHLIGPQQQLYERWVRQYDTLDAADRTAIGRHITGLNFRPVISVVMPVYNPHEPHLRQAIESVLAQLYPHWELCVADDASTKPHVRTILEDYRERDPRIRIIYRSENGHISAASNSALELATGEFVAFLDHDDLLSEDALYEIAAEINAYPEADLVYSDCDNIDDNGRRWGPYFKPDWDPDLIVAHNLVSHLGVYRRALVARIGGLRVGFEGSQDWDLMLRVAQASAPDRIRHVPAVLYHWRRSTSSPAFSEKNIERCTAAARRAVTEYFSRTGTSVRVEPAPNISQWNRIVYPLPSGLPLVSIIVPTRDRADFLRRCTDGILKNTKYSNLELLIIDNDSQETETHHLFDDLGRDPRVRILRYPGTFNFSAMNNRAVVEARGEIIVFMNNDVEVISPSWLEEMTSQALRPEVGAVGAKLLYPDGRVQHAGVVLGVGDGAGHFFHLLAGRDVGYFNFPSLVRRVSAVTAACMALRRSIFLDFGGFDDVNLPVAFNDVDLCLRIGQRGYAVVYTPHAELYHHESASRGRDREDRGRRARFQREASYLRKRWSALMERDPYYNQNCSTARANFEPGFPPRRQKPWLAWRQLVPRGSASSSRNDSPVIRADQLLAPIDRQARIIEIGPSYCPIAPKAEGWNTATVDHTSREELVKKYTGAPHVDVGKIEEVDFVWTDGPLLDAVPYQLHGTFDALIASHVIEHTTDFIGFLDAAETLLGPNGIVILAIPDKRYCFDYFRPLTTTGEVLSANEARRSRHTRRIVFDHHAYVVKNSGNGAWGQDPVGTMEFFHTLDEASQAFSELSESPSEPYVDMHAWQFTPASFELLMLELAFLGKTDWQIERVTPATGCEFYAWLRRGGKAAAATLSQPELDARRLGLLKLSLLQIREQIDFMVAGHPSVSKFRNHAA